jgi:hypothetical protein
VIEGLVGRPGSGKSYTLTEKALRAAKGGRDVFVNYPVAGCYLFGPEDLLHLPPGLIVIDEAHLWFPARMALRLPPSWLAGLSQTRKNGWDLLWAAQHENRVDRVLRDVTSWQWLCSAWFSYAGHPVLFRATSWEPEFFRNPAKKQITTNRIFDPKVAGSYNTLEKLVVAQHATSDKDVYDKPPARAGRRNASVLEGAMS